MQPISLRLCKASFCLNTRLTVLLHRSGLHQGVYKGYTPCLHLYPPLIPPACLYTPCLHFSGTAWSRFAAPTRPQLTLGLIYSTSRQKKRSIECVIYSTRFRFLVHQIHCCRSTLLFTVLLHRITFTSSKLYC